MAVQPLLFDCTWAQQWKYESAEAYYQQVLSGQTVPGSSSAQINAGPNNSQGSNLKNEIAAARQNIQKALNEAGGGSSGDAGVDKQVLNRIQTLETENKNLKKASEDLTALVKKLEARVSSLEKSGGGGGASSAPAPAPADDDDDSDFDPFGDDDSESDDEETKKRLAEYHAKKAKKTAVIAKSSLLIDVKPWDDETDMGELERLVRTIEMDGLVWGQAKLIPVGYGIKKLQINAVIEDKVSTDDLEEKVTAFEDLVQSMDIAAFNKI